MISKQVRHTETITIPEGFVIESVETVYEPFRNLFDEVRIGRRLKITFTEGTQNV